MRHGLHRPNRCCICCHAVAVSSDPIGDVLRRRSSAPTSTHPNAEPDIDDGTTYDHPPPDRGVVRTLAARIQTSENAGDRW